MLKFRSSIKKSFIKKTLFKGIYQALFGCLFILFSGIFIPLNFLEWVGGPIFLISILLITIGLYPYQSMKTLENNPHELKIFDDEKCLFSWKRKPMLSFHFNQIEKIAFIDEKTIYGIGINFNLPVSKCLKNMNSEFDIETFHKKSKNQYGYDLFLPYFSKNSFTEFNDLMGISRND